MSTKPGGQCLRSQFVSSLSTFATQALRCVILFGRPGNKIKSDMNLRSIKQKYDPSNKKKENGKKGYLNIIKIAVFRIPERDVLEKFVFAASGRSSWQLKIHNSIQFLVKKLKGKEGQNMVEICKVVHTR